jgi:hypothetical protein
VIKQPADYLAWGAIMIALIGFILMLVGFSRLLAEAWKRPNRWKAVWKVVDVSPRRNSEWPNATPEADLIAKGALLGGLILCILIVGTVISFAQQ